jgi:anti-sigma-K factor RskA
LKLDVDGHGVVSTSADATLAKATGFAITDEPAGGSIAAQGRKLLFGAY